MMRNQKNDDVRPRFKWPERRANDSEPGDEETCSSVAVPVGSSSSSMRSESETPALAAPLASRAGEHAVRDSNAHTATRRAEKEGTDRTIARSGRPQHSKMRAVSQQPRAERPGIAAAPLSDDTPRRFGPARAARFENSGAALLVASDAVTSFDGICRDLTATPGAMGAGRRACDHRVRGVSRAGRGP